jgi:hypothetical protein
MLSAINISSYCLLEIQKLYLGSMPICQSGYVGDFQAVMNKRGGAGFTSMVMGRFFLTLTYF